MDVMSLFSKKLKPNNDSLATAEQKWDKRAKNFYKNQITRRDYFPGAVTELLMEKGIIDKTSTVLDICSGSGRYAIPFAEKSKSVLAIDLSSEMLNYLNKEIKKRDFRNIKTLKTPWPSPEKLEKVNVSFAAMCPAIRTVEALTEMSEIASDYGVICQFIYSSDNIVESLKERGLLKEDVKDPHSNRSSVQAYFNILWEFGFNPEVTYLEDVHVTKMSVEEAVQHYERRYDGIDINELTTVLNELASNEEISLERIETIAVINWETTKAKNK